MITDSQVHIWTVPVRAQQLIRPQLKHPSGTRRGAIAEMTTGVDQAVICTAGSYMQ